MVSFGEKDKIKKAGNLNQGRSYVITTVFMVTPQTRLELCNIMNEYKKPKNECTFLSFKQL